MGATTPHGLPPSPMALGDDALYSDAAGLLAKAGHQALQRRCASPLELPKPHGPSIWTRCRQALRRVPRLQAADSLGEILRRGLIDAHTTLVFDLDRTLIRNRDNAYPRDWKLWPDLTEPVEPNTAQVVRRLQQSGVPIFGLTARFLGATWEVADLTEAQLHKIGVDLSTTAPVGDVANYGLRFRAATRAGITYCGHHDKGEVLDAIYQRRDLGRVVVIDDGMHNFASLFEAARARKRDLTCVYYRHDLQAPRTRR